MAKPRIAERPRVYSLKRALNTKWMIWEIKKKYKYVL